MAAQGAEARSRVIPRSRNMGVRCFCLGIVTTPHPALRAAPLPRERGCITIKSFASKLLSPVGEGARSRVIPRSRNMGVRCFCLPIVTTPHPALRAAPLPRERGCITVKSFASKLPSPVGEGARSRDIPRSRNMGVRCFCLPIVATPHPALRAAPLPRERGCITVKPFARKLPSPVGEGARSRVIPRSRNMGVRCR